MIHQLLLFSSVLQLFSLSSYLTDTFVLRSLDRVPLIPTLGYNTESNMSDLAFNSYPPTCVVNQCLQQVAGYVDSNPLVQSSAYVSMFGSPVVTTV